MTRTRVGVLVSGGGTNLQALLDACANPAYPAEIALVISNRAGVGALDRAAAAGVPARVLHHRGYASRDDYDAALVAALRDAGVSIVCLAGFMRLVTATLLDAFPNRVLNVHPALLPAFPGLNGAEQAVAYGARIAGCTVHLVDVGTDTGPIVCQGATPVLPDDDATSLAAQVLQLEHQLYPRALRWLAEGRLRLDGRRVVIDGVPDAWLWRDRPQSPR